MEVLDLPQMPAILRAANTLNAFWFGEDNSAGESTIDLKADAPH